MADATESMSMKIRSRFFGLSLLGAVLMQACSSDAQLVIKIAAGKDYSAGFSLFLKADGSLWGMGDNYFGELGDGTFGSPYYGTNWPEQIVAGNVTAIAAGDNHTLFLKSDGSLWAMGNDQYGQLGDGFSYGLTNRPEKIVASNVTAIAAGWSHSLFLKSGGSLWGVGRSDSGQIGADAFVSGNPYGTNRPVQIVASNVTAIAAGGYHTLFIKSDGSLWAMGANFWGQLGDGANSSISHPEQIVSSNVTAIAAGELHSLFLMNDGSLWAMGYNYYGQLGDGTYNRPAHAPYGTNNRPELIVASNVTAIAAGGVHSLFIKSDGSLWGMGWNNDGQLGDGTSGAGSLTNRPKQTVAGGVTAIAAGYFHSLFLMRDGSLWGMGRNNYGQLGDGTFNFNTNRPEQILGAYNQIAGQLSPSAGNMELSFVGIAGANYALERSFSLAPPDWLPQATNPANSFGALVFTNLPNPATNNFWRIRSVP